MKILFVIDEIELKYFEFNVLVTNFWLIYEFLQRQFEVLICVKSSLYLKNNKPFALCYKAFLKDDNIFYEKNELDLNLGHVDAVFMRPDPPVDIDYINATYVLDFLDTAKTVCFNSPSSLRNKNEKLYVNEFPELSVKNIVSANPKVIKDFLFSEDEIIIKPLNRCFSSGVFYLNKEDKNINAIINTATDNSKTQVMVQKFLPDVVHGDMRLIFICGEILPYSVIKKASNNDFKFNEHIKSNLLKGELTPKQKKIQNIVKDKFLSDGIYLAGLDVIGDRVLEINITSPCFFINEINSLFDIELNKIVVDKILNFLNEQSGKQNNLNFSQKI